MKNPVHARRVASLLLSTFLVAAVALAAGPPPPPPPPPQQDAAHGRVVDAAGLPVVGARVTRLPAPPRSSRETALQDQVVTDQGGRFSLPLPPNGKGNLQGIQIRAVGYPAVILHGVTKAGPRGRAMDLGTIVLKQNSVPAE
jgi:hypothetical protein